MLKNDRFKHLKTWYHYFIILIVIQVFFCVQFKNPVDPAFKGSYDFKVDNFKSPVVLSIFQPCTLYINDSLGKDRYNAFSCYAKKDSVARVNPINSSTFQIVFYKPCTTDVVVKGIHPNGNMDERVFKNVAVLNPYLIDGNDTISKNDTIELSIARSDSSKDISPLISNIQWSDGKRIAIKDRDSTFTIQCDSAQSDSTLITATLIYDDTTSYTLNKKITFKGWSPRIKTIGIKSFNPNDTGNIISQTDSFKIKITIDDPDTNTTKVEIIEGTTTIGSVKLMKFSGTDSITLPPIMNPKANQFLVRVFDKSGYTDSSEVIVIIKESAPQVFLKKMISIAYENSYSFVINSSINCTGFQWVLNDSILDTTLSGICKIPPLSTGTYTLKVTPLNKYNEKFKAGETKVCVINAKEYNYWTIFKEYKDTINVKVNRLCTLAVAVTKNDTVINDTGVFYLWPDDIDSNNITINNTYAVFHYKDSIQPFMFNVNGVVNGDTADDAEITVVVRLNRPQFNFFDTLYELSVDNAVYLKYKAIPNPNDSTPVSSIYYRIPVLSDSVFKYDSASGIRFSTIGDYIIEMWCVDRDSIKSIPDTAQVEIYSDLPVISLKSPTLAVALNDTVTISGIQTKPGRDGKTVDSILYDSNNDGIYDVAVKVGGNSTTEIKLKPYTRLVTDTITFICKDIAGKFSSPVIQYINVFSSIPKIESCQLLSTSTKYKSLPADFKISITDPDDSLLHLKVFANGVVFDSLDSVGSQDIISLKFNTSGTYRLQFVAVDSKLHESDTLSLADLLVINPGKPVITAFNIKDSLTYINDTIRCIPAGIDHNGTIKKYLYFINDTNSNSVTLMSDTLKYAFADSGRYVIYTRIIDNDTLSSAFAADTVVVRRGQPVVETFSPGSPSVFVNDSMSFPITVSETNGRVIKRVIDLNGKIIDSTLYGIADTIKSFKYFFTAADSGWNILKARVLDDDTIYSEWKECSLYVNPGVPSITKILINKDTSWLFIKDPVVFTITMSDPNNNADSLYLMNNSTVIKGVKLDSMICNISYTFQKIDTTLSQVNFKVIDGTKFSSISSLPLHISSGAPKVDSVNITGPTGSTFYVNDLINFRVNVSDKNGVPRKIKASWNNELSPVESLNVIAGGSQSIGYAEFTHKYDTLLAGNRTVRFWVDDTDMVLSAPEIKTITMHMGAPAIWGNSDDTIWVLVKQGYGDYYYKPNYIDSNGTIDTFYFGLTDNISQAAKGTADTSKITVEQATIHNGTVSRYIWGKDNDSIIRGGRFVVFADSAPPEPLVVNPLSSGDSITLRWSRYDLKDGKDATTFGVKINYTGGNPTDLLIEQVGSQFGWDGTKYTYKFKPTSSAFTYKIYAKDARGSISECITQTYEP